MFSGAVNYAVHGCSPLLTKSLHVTVQIKATEKYSPMVLFIMLVGSFISHYLHNIILT